ncbi:transmembrane emp24 domain-containing protein 5-like [Lytechinus variegatus]|uniref:transmembrane emp24 domain-containing protein 5-like n=1 Tax=Lytechinus variegatus TaxID=7654 RepID=UPI001BB273BF|nr:transmembrane emp24 domain-containing protein 5-like [Lytechinus variegatus]XP_041467232.1 transmembrane emp24 domain-containing protein 5-like [Lytechinus variegatus]
MENLRLILGYFILLIVAELSSGIMHDLTVIVPPGRRECFHQTMNSGSNLEFEFQVLEGGDLDINFILRSPTNKALATEARKQDGIYSFNLQETGDYLMCFDNSFSRMSEKIVYFDLALDYEDEGESDVPKWMDAVANRNEEVEITMEEIQTSLDIVSDNLRKSQTHQRQWRNIEFRDRYLTERNFERVNFWSAVNTIVMLVTLIIQVVMIRSLFANNTKVRT